MGMFEDVKAAEIVENVELKTMKNRFAALSEEYKNALDKVETLLSEQQAMEDYYRDALDVAKKEIAMLKSAFSTVMDELKHEQKSKAAICRNRNFWKRESEEMGMLYHLTSCEFEQIKNTKRPVKTVKIDLKKAEERELPFMMAAAIGK